MLTLGSKHIFDQLLPMNSNHHSLARNNVAEDQGKMFGIFELGPISVGTRPTNPCIYVKFSASNHQLLASLPIRNEVRDGNHFEGMFRRELNEIA